MGEPSGSAPIEIDQEADPQPPVVQPNTSMGPPLHPTTKNKIFTSPNVKKKKGRKPNAEKNLNAGLVLIQNANKRGRSEVERESYNESDYESKDQDCEGNSAEMKSLIAQVAKLVKTITTQSQTVSKLNDLVVALTNRLSSVETELQTKIKMMESKIETLSTKVEGIKSGEISANVGLPSSQPTWATVVSTKRGKINETSKGARESNHFTVPPQQIDQTNFVLAEKEDREKKRHNLIVFGLKVESGTEDRERVEHLFTSIGVDKNIVEHVRRFRQTKQDSTSIEPIYVRIKSGEDRMRVVASAKKLRKLDGFSGVYICPDKTLCERRLDKQLRDERDARNESAANSEEGRQFWYVIRDGQVRKVKRFFEENASKQ